MTLYADPSEFASTTRNPKTLLDAAVKLGELEEFSGADWLISTISEPKIEVLDESRACAIKLRKHLDHGMLVQRKTTDLAPSLPELKRILSEMMALKPRFGSWLLFVGDLSDLNGKPQVNGQDVYGMPNLTYQTMLMTFCKWQLRGGLISQVKDARSVTSWVNGMMKLMADIEANPEVVIEPRPIVQSIVDNTATPWRRTLMSLPSIRERRANLIAEHCGTLAESLCWLTDPDSVKKDHLEGIGKGIVEAMRVYFGLKDGQFMRTYGLWDTYASVYPENIEKIMELVGTPVENGKGEIPHEESEMPPWD